jgi:CTP synthase
MQVAVIEFARNVCEIPGADSAEFRPGCEHPVIIAMPELDKLHAGGTMQLGLRATELQPGSEWSRLRKFYDGQQTIEDRHRHRHEVNPDYIERLSSRGLHFVGKDSSGVRMQVIELKDHPWYVDVQYHPEYQSRVLDPSKPYLGFVAAAVAKRSHINGAVHTNDTAHTDGEAHVKGEV